MKFLRPFSLSLLLCASAPLCVSAQTSLEEISADLNKAGGVYYAYPSTSHQTTPPPKGYQPFYVSHYGRHGSRYLISDSDYTDVADALKKAARADQLTPLGIDVLNRLDSVMKETDRRGGDLTPLGVRQHRGIAERLYNAYPQIFKGSPAVSARSTVVPRCILSMDAFCERLKELNPNLQTTRESSNRYMDYLNYHSDESNTFTGGDWRIEYAAFEEERVRPERMMTLLFKDPDWVKKNIRSRKLYWGLYWIAVDAQNIETSISFYDLFTPEELYALWEIGNFNNYVLDANYEPGKGLVVGNARNLLQNIIDSAEEAIATPGTAATLRFGHDGNLMPLAAILEMENCDVSISDAEQIASVWSNFKVSPMAGNVQMIFFRDTKNPEKEILVKFLLNENETGINTIDLDIPADLFPFYRWSDVKAHYRKKHDLK